ncbi:hypothetical protein Cgig2_033325 [Carnegiea gigantea]|uniref:Uncharacterized protein n=1 Tax=Carnegiea gigantea TaxID=171969 RepID=A0A9Q1KSJ8_9CARY|nr:hypothetical protein Cgig2_033325 [Carnegiea gigantea]
MESHSPSPQQPSPTINPSPKRGPGRPPKPKSDTAQPTSEVARKRGRPPKQQLEAQPVSEATLSEEKRRPGRPPKQVVVPFSEPDSAVGAAEDGAVKRQVGRPPKLNVVRASGGGSGRPRGRPRKSVLGPVSRPIGKQPRGRPRKLGGGGVAAVGMVAGKRRGRPPKGSNPRKPRRLSGKPLGRPRKDASAARSLKFEQGQGQANEELTAKLELIQLKIREAVGIIKPYVANENVALVALQQLEELVITEPPATSIPPMAPQPESLAVDPSLTAPLSEPAP